MGIGGISRAGRGGAGGEGRVCCELGAGLLGAGGAGTPPLSPAPSLGLEVRAQGKSWYWGLGGHHPGPGKCSQVLTNAGAGGRGARGMSQCPSREWGRDARPRAEIPVLKWLLCLSLQRGILKASPSLALSSSPPPPPSWGRSPGWPAERWHAAPRPGRGAGGGPADGAGSAHPRGLPSELLPSPHPCRSFGWQPTLLSPAGRNRGIQRRLAARRGRGRHLPRQDPTPPRLEPGVWGRRAAARGACGRELAVPGAAGGRGGLPPRTPAVLELLPPR